MIRTNLARESYEPSRADSPTRGFSRIARSLGDVVVSGETIHAAIVDDDVLHTFREASRSTPLAQTPALMETCREMFFRAFDFFSLVAKAIIIKTRHPWPARRREVLGSCPDDPGEPLLPAAEECLERFTVDARERVREERRCRCRRRE